jgi:hypothetical protein
VVSKVPLSAIFLSATFPVLGGTCLFLAAGRLDIAPFWEYLAFCAVAAFLSLLVIDPGLLRERMKPGGESLNPAYYILGGLMFTSH